LRNLEARLTSSVHFNFHDAGGVVRVPLDIRCGQSQLVQLSHCLSTQVVIPDPAGDDSVIPKQAGDVGKIGGRSAELLPFWQ
jgi:hypothetical protein